MQAEKAVGPVGAFGDDLAMLVLGEPVDHHPVESGHLADDPRAGIGKLCQRTRFDEFRDVFAAQILILPDARRVWFGMQEFEDDMPLVPMRQAFQVDPRAIRPGETDEPGAEQLRRRGLQRQRP